MEVETSLFKKGRLYTLNHPDSEIWFYGWYDIERHDIPTVPIERYCPKYGEMLMFLGMFRFTPLPRTGLRAFEAIAVVFLNGEGRLVADVCSDLASISALTKILRKAVGK